MYKVLFDLKKEYYYSSLFPLYQEFAKDKKNFDLYLAVGSNHKKFLKIFNISQQKKIEDKYRKMGFKITAERKGYDLIVTADRFEKPERYDKNALLIHIDHGVGIKTLRIRNVLKQPDFRYCQILEGQYWYDYIKSIGWENKADFIVDTGMPKLDPFFWEGHFNNDKLVKELGIDPEKKTVLFAPSYKPSCIEYVQQTITELLPDYNLVIKLHPYSWGGKYAPHSQHKFYEKLAEQNKEVFLIPEDDIDIYPYLYLADTMISDTSSVVNEFLALGKHGIIYVLPYEKLNHSDGMPVLSIDPAEWLKGAFPHMYKPEDLLPAVKSACNPTTEMKTKLQEYRDYWFTGLDGKASERAKKRITEMLEARKG